MSEMNAIWPPSRGLSRIPAGRFYVPTPIVVDANSLGFEGEGRFATTLWTDNPAGLFRIVGPGGRYFLRFSRMRLESSAGPVFTVDPGCDGVALSTWEDISLYQSNPAQPIFDQQAGVFLDNLINNFDLTGQSAHTVPLWRIVTNVAGANKNTWQHGRCTYSGCYVFHLENTQASNFAYDNTFSRINFETTMGGNIRLLSCRGTALDFCNTYDLSGPTTRDLYLFDKSGGAPTTEVMCRNVQRRGGALGAGLFDMRFAQGAGNSTLDRVTGTVNLGGQGASITTIASPELVTVAA